MGWLERGPDDDAARVKESWDRIKNRFGERQARLHRQVQSERAWYDEVDRLIAQPQLLDQKNKDELDYLRITAEGLIEELDSKSKSVGTFGSQILSAFARHKGASDLGDVFGGFTSALVTGKISKNRHLVRLIEAKEKRDRVALPQPSRAEIIAAKHAERHREREELITLLEKQRDEQIRKYPERAESINKRYRKLIDAAIEEE